MNIIEVANMYCTYILVHTVQYCTIYTYRILYGHRYDYNYIMKAVTTGEKVDMTEY